MLATRASAQRGATREVRGATEANATHARPARLKGYRATCVRAFAQRRIVLLCVSANLAKP
jgi:hypothetical protein